MQIYGLLSWTMIFMMLDKQGKRKSWSRTIGNKKEGSLTRWYPAGVCTHPEGSMAFMELRKKDTWFQKNNSCLVLKLVPAKNIIGAKLIAGDLLFMSGGYGRRSGRHNP